MKLFKLFVPLATVALLPAILSACGSSDLSSKEIENVDLVPVTTSRDGKWSMINEDGELVYDAEFKNRPTAAYNGLFSVEEGKGYSVYKVGGKKPELVKGLENLKSVGYLEEGLIPVTFPGKRIALVDEDGNTKFELKPIQGAEVVKCAPGFSDGILNVETADGKCGFVDTKGNTVGKAEYDYIKPYSEGLAVVGNRDNDQTQWKVIDKSGKIKFKIKDGYELSSSRFRYGYIVVRKDDRVYMLNEKGEETKLASKIMYVVDYNEDFIIFEDEEGSTGVADFNGEIIIRPKYYQIIFSNDDYFLVKKDKKDEEYIKMDKKGEEIEGKIDYENIQPFGKFGYFAKEGKTVVLLSNDYTKKGKEEFYDINLGWDNGYVTTDYFNVNEVATEMVKMINGDGIGTIKVGATASSVMQGKSPKNYLYDSSVDFGDLTKQGFRYEIQVACTFSDRIAEYEYDYNNYGSKYYWNPSSKLRAIFIILHTESEWGQSGQNALKRALSSAGYKFVKEGLWGNELAAAYEKGSFIIIANSPKKGHTGSLVIVAQEDKADFLNDIRPQTGNAPGIDDGDDYDYDGLDVESACAVETVAVAVPAYEAVAAEYY